MLPDILRPGLRLVVCGTAPGTVSAQRKAYYAFPGNRFWPTLAAVGLTTRLLLPAEYSLLPEFGIGLTDLVKDQSGADAALRFAHADRSRLERVLMTYQPRYLAFNGKRSAQEYLGVRRVDYGLQETQVGVTRLFVLPSTSGLAVKSWNVSHWQELARRVALLPVLD